MNSLQLNVILPQQQTQNLNPTQTQKNGGESFADALNAAQKSGRELEPEINSSSRENSVQNADAKTAGVKNAEERSAEQNSADGEKISKNNEEPKKAEDSKVEKTDESSKDKKTAAKDKENDGKNLNGGKDLEASILASMPAKNPNAVSNKNISNKKLLQNADEGASVSAAEKSEESAKVAGNTALLKTAKTKTDAENALEENSDGFAELVDAAIEFIPKSGSEAENLEGEQNSAISEQFADDQSFLAQVHQLADAEIANARQKENADFSDDKGENAGDVKSKRNKLNFDVHDLRTAKTQGAEKIDKESFQNAPAEKSLELSQAQKDGDAAQLTMELSGKANADITSSSSQAAGANGSVFQSMLSASVHENAGEIVKAGNIILKDNNQGSINLILKPESLGNVKISLNLNDKVISGQISVQSREAFEAFRESLGSLKQAFADSGFETGNFDLNFSQQSFAQGGNSGNENPSASYFAEKTYGGFVALGDAKTSSEEAGFDSSAGNYSVNIVA